MIQVEFVPATLAHAMTMAPHVQAADIAEVYALSRLPILFALELSVRTSTVARTALIDGEPVGMFGCSPRCHLTRTGSPWLLVTDAVQKYRKRFLMECRPRLAEVAANYRHLHNFVDARHEVAIRWLKWLGFELHPAEPMGAFGLPFHPFTKEC